MHRLQAKVGVVVYGRDGRRGVVTADFRPKPFINNRLFTVTWDGGGVENVPCQVIYLKLPEKVRRYLCRKEGCTNPAKTDDLCQSHYQKRLRSRRRK
jgi:hypothetical protein